MVWSFYRLFLLLVCILSTTRAAVSTEPTIVCNEVRFVPEGKSLRCNCTGTSSAVISWPGHSNTPFLTVDNVQRKDNGTVYTCQIVEEGMENKTAKHTLLVAYGPSNEDVSIVSSPPSITKETKSVTLTCEVKDVYPSVNFSWSGLCSSNRAECTISLQPEHYNETAVCTAVNSIFFTHSGHEIRGYAVYHLQLTSENQTPEKSHAENVHSEGRLIILCLVATTLCLYFKSWLTGY